MIAAYDTTTKTFPEMIATISNSSITSGNVAVYKGRGAVSIISKFTDNNKGSSGSPALTTCKCHESVDLHQQVALNEFASVDILQLSSVHRRESAEHAFEMSSNR